MIIIQCLKNQGYITTEKDIINRSNSLILKYKFFLFCNFFAKINKKGRKNREMPVGFVRKTKANEMPEKIEYLKFLESLKYHFVKNNKFKILKDVSDKSMR